MAPQTEIEGMIARLLLVLVLLLLLAGVGAAGGALYVFYEFGRGLPDHQQLADHEPPVTTRVHAGDGRLLTEYAIEKRVFVPIGAMPRRVVHAFLAAEDQNFYHHMGIDPQGILRAAITNLRNVGSGRRLQGASTITQQVAKNFLLTNEVSYRRKIQEAILALRIERALPKERILELYLNEIYLGYGSYGVAAAALNYFNKSLDELTIAEAAFLAALPKAPNNYDPRRRPEAAKTRRDWVIGRMAEEGWVDAAQAGRARDEPLTVRTRAATKFANADYFAEEVRRRIAGLYGESALYGGGLSVRTSLDPRLQDIARRSLREGLIAYDRRHGYRGPLGTLNDPDSARLPPDALDRLRARTPPPGLPGPWRVAAVTKVTARTADLMFADATTGTLPYSDVRWARAQLPEQKRGADVRRVSDVLSTGDLILVERLAPDPEATDAARETIPPDTYGLRQMPEIQGAILAMDPHTGRVLAMQGGFSFAESEFNRATQAARQPGSAFKPFVYLAAIDHGYTPASIVLDAPFVIDQGPGLPKWRPSNYSREFYGPSTLRLGLEKSRNLMTVRLAQSLGMEVVAGYAERFGVVDGLPQTLAMSLGAAETTLLRLTTGYAMLVNGGKKISPSLIDRVQDRRGRTVFRHDTRPCVDCRADAWTGQPVPKIPDTRPQLTAPASAFQVVSMLEGVVLRGTGRRIASLGRPLAGKTGTTNDSLDTWFIGFSPDLAVGVFMGFDEPRSLGARETGSSVAAPVFKAFMAEALTDAPMIPFRIPDDIRLVQVDARTGKPAALGAAEGAVILEAFKPGTVPSLDSDGGGGGPTGPGFGATGSPAVGTGGLY